MKFNLEKTSNEQKPAIGDIILTKNKCEDIKHYLVVDSGDDVEECAVDYFLIDLDFSEVRCTVRLDTIKDYIENKLHEEIIEIIPAEKVTMSRKKN